MYLVEYRVIFPKFQVNMTDNGQGYFERTLFLLFLVRKSFGRCSLNLLRKLKRLSNKKDQLVTIHYRYVR